MTTSTTSAVENPTDGPGPDGAAATEAAGRRGRP